MASVREELLCSICLEIFTNPVTLMCGHNFCWNCITHALDTRLSRFYTCPQCRKRFRSRPVLTKNTTLGNIARQFASPKLASVYCTYCDPHIPAVKTCLQCETSMCNRHLQNHNRSVQHNLMDCIISLQAKKCPIHKRIRGYYCPLNAICLCVSCCLSEEFRGLQVEPLNVAYAKKKKILQKLLNILTIKKEGTERRVQNLKKNVQKLQRKADDQEEMPTEETMLVKEQNLSCVTNQIKELEREKQQLEWKIFWVVELSRQIDPIYFLEDVAISSEGFDRLHVAEGLIPGTVPKYVLDIASKAKKWWFPNQFPADVWLNVNTAASNILISDNHKAAIYSDVLQPHPETLERFEKNQVLSINLFSSGRHYWDVECGPLGDWMIGVCYPTMDRKGKKSFLGCNSRSWCLRRRDNEFWVQHDIRCLHLPNVKSCNYVRVSLNCKIGQLTFHSFGPTIRHLHTYNIVFTEPLHAAFTLFSGWIKIREKEGLLLRIEEVNQRAFRY